MDISTKQIAPLPRVPGDWVRKTELNRTINDLIEDAHLALLADSKTAQKYLPLLDAVYDEQAVEGSLAADNILAAQMIREWARDGRNTKLAREKLASINKALGVVLRRYGVSRSERRNMIDGVVVTPSANNGD